MMARADGSPIDLRSEAPSAPRLRLVADFGANPGALRCHLYEPACRPRRAPLVVVLHGCGQTAAGFDAASGWSRLAAAHGFLVLYPEQSAGNNAGTCFSWFEPGDVTRGRGEVASIAAMIDWAVAEHGADPAGVHVCGLSAGGAMAAAMLATYPERFAAGAVVAGLPYGAAAGQGEAFDAMFTGRVRDPRRWGDLVRAASDHAGPWPRVAIWFGTADPVVRPINAGELVKQWTDVHGVGRREPLVERVGSATHRSITRRTWHDGEGEPCVIAYSVPDLGHGHPVDEIDPPAPFFLPAGIAATRQIAGDFGLLDRPIRDPLAGRSLALHGLAE